MRTLSLSLLATATIALAACASNPPPEPPPTPSASNTTTVTPPVQPPAQPPRVTPPVPTGPSAGSKADFAVKATDRVYFDYDAYNLDSDDQRSLASQIAWIGLGPIEHRPPLERHGSRVRPLQADQHAGQRGLPAADPSEHADPLARGDLPAQRVDHR